jgi:branched-chain amino acid transport system ATP-binding protein
MLEVMNLNAGYGKLQVLYDVSVTIKNKNITVIIGPNGSGKSTFLKAIMNMVNVYSGKVVYDGRDMTHLPPYKRVREGLAYLPQVGNVFTNLTVRENLSIAGCTLNKNVAKMKMEEVLDFFPVLRKYINKKVAKLSGGERQMVAMGMALMKNAKLILFDEPTSGLSPKLSLEVLNNIARLNEELGMTVVMVEQAVRQALIVGNEAYLLVAGRVRFKGEADELLNNPELGKLYLGVK